VLRSISKIVGGTASAQLIALLAMPFISRLYLPADYGLFGVIVAITMVFAIISSFQLHQAIVLPKVKSHAIGLFQLACLGVMAGGALTAIFAYSYWYIFHNDMETLDMLQMSLLTGLAVAAVGIGQAGQGLAVREKAFGRIGIAAMIRASVVIAIQITLGLSGSGAIGLLAGYVAGEVAALFYLFKFALPAGSFKPQMQWKRLRVLVGRYKDFVSFGTAQEAMNSASQGLPVMLLAAYFGPTVAGYYAFALKILMAPVNMLAGAVRQVLSVRFAEAQSSPAILRHDFRRITIALAVPSILGALLIMPFTPDLFSMLFGIEWSESGEYGVWLLLWCVFGIFNVPATLIFRILRRQNVSLMINALLLVTRVAVLIVGGIFFLPIETVFAFSMAGIAWNMVIIGVASGYVRHERGGLK